MSLEMYQQNILDHYHHPHNEGVLKSAKAHAHVVNTVCGDEIDFYINYDTTGQVSEVKFTGRGCTISQAAASMLTDELKGMTKEAVKKLTGDDVVKLLGVKINPARLKCATLSLEAAQQAIKV